ncbi:methyl-accepting chemotaxis protein [Paenibacillus naphthalenovorans]|uniref:methyl-accepting chemotaxis protein n=1 Tax=Paenibacillus naphthalenovorans TaxID=162209 RepID=UPI003D28163A
MFKKAWNSLISLDRNNRKQTFVITKKNPMKSVGMKLFLIFFASVVVLVVAMGASSYFISKNVIQEKVADASLQTIVQTSRKLDILYNSFEDIFKQALSDSDLKLLILKYYSAPEGSFDQMEIGSQIIAQISALSNADTMYAISLLDKNGKAIVTTGNPPNTEVTDTDWFKKVSSAAEGVPVWLETRNDGFFGTQGVKSFALAGILPDISGGEDHAIVLFEYKYSVFQNEMNDVKMGETGFAAIVSPDHRMVYDPNEELVGSGSKVAVNLDQAQYSDIVVDPSGESQLVVYQQSSKTGWYTLGSVPMNELLAETKKISGITVLMTLIAALVACGIGYLVVRIIARPLVELRNLMKEGERGNLVVRCTVNSRDEIGELAQSFNQMMEQITLLVQQTNRSAQEVLSTSSELSEAARKTAASAKEIAVATEEIAGGAGSLAVEAERGSDIMQTIGKQMEQVVEVNKDMVNSATQVQQASKQGTEYMVELISKTNSTEQMTRSLIEKVDHLKESTRSIRKILDVLHNVTKQTNILSLNAAIEAARAGAAGKGFMVVADEIRKLADQSKQSIDVVGQIIETIQSEIDETVSVLSTAYPLFQEQIASVKEADTLFNQVQEHMDGFVQKLTDVSLSINRLDESQYALSAAIHNVSAVAEQSSATTEEVASLSHGQTHISEELVRLSEKLESLSDSLEAALTKFRV